MACLKRGLEAHNASCTGASSMRVARAMLMVEPASIDGNELTDKGYINQRAGLERRAELVERLYADMPDEDVIVCNESGAKPSPSSFRTRPSSDRPGIQRLLTSRFRVRASRAPE